MEVEAGDADSHSAAHVPFAYDFTAPAPEVHLSVREYVPGMPAWIHPGVQLWGCIVAALLLFLVSKAAAAQRCVNRTCGSRPHPAHAVFIRYCCKKCGISQAKGYEHGDHGPHCERVEAGHSASCESRPKRARLV